MVFLNNVLVFIVFFSISGQPGSRHLPKTSRNSPEELVDRDNHGVCLFLTTVINPADWTTSYANKFIHYMRNVFLVSVERQFKEPCPGLETFKLLILGRQDDPKLSELYEYGKNPGEIPIVWHNRSNFSDFVKETVLKHSCKWISTIWLDADDALLDGYFKYITEEIPRMLTRTTTSDGKFWRGAMFALRSPKWLEVGLNRCEGIFEGRIIYCGYSQGQGVILRRSLWEKLGQEFLYHGFHAQFLKIVREYVMHGLGHKDYISMAGVGKYGLWEETAEMIAFERSDAAESQIKMVDLTKRWKTSAVFVKTPFSSSFPWKRINELPLCTEEHIITIKREFPREVEFIIKAWIEHQNMHVTMLEVCRNNMYFHSKLGNHTCEEVDTAWRKSHNYP